MNLNQTKEKRLPQADKNESAITELREGNRVWKVGSRLSHDGNAGSCILELFRKYHVAFVGHEHRHFSKIQKGDLIAISSGKKVVALGRAMDDPKALSEIGIIFSKSDSRSVHPFDIGIACRINFLDLKESDFVGYRIGAFHGVNQRADQFRLLYNTYQKAKKTDNFSIKARSCTLLINSESPSDILLKPSLTYHVPIFQRPYSWGLREIRRLLMDLLNAYDGRLGRAKREPMFIGTMQISAAKPLDTKKGTSRHDIIDGQQRMTTIALILRAVQLQGGAKPDPEIAWLSIAIGGDTQQDYLNDALNEQSPIARVDPQNRYLENLKLIISQLQHDDALETVEDFSAFYDYLTSHVFSVVIETEAGLSKTLQIFNSINTSGMDLNGGDIFKIRYYEYLREREGHGESVFDQISKLYTKIERQNKEFGGEKIRMKGILDCVKWIVCEQLKLPYAARELAGTTFFDRLFDTVLKIETWEGFPFHNCAQLELPVTLLDEVIDATSNWHLTASMLRPEAMVMNTFIWWSRYGNYHDALIVNFLWRFSPTQKELEDFIVNISKLLIVHSIRSQKKTFHGHKVMHDTVKKICHVGITIDALLSSVKSDCGSEAVTITDRLMNDWLADIPKTKNLVCRLVDFLNEIEAGELTGEVICKLLFREQEIDIEHIEPANHRDGTIRQEIRNLWGQDLHGLGNLTVLERNINRSISNSPYDSHKRGHYLTSKFTSVKAFAIEHHTWTLDRARERKKSLTTRLTSYLCGKADVRIDIQEE